MNVDDPRNELYRDFVQLVDKVSSAIIKESIVPISGQMTDASRVMRKAVSDVESLSESISNNGVKTDLLRQRLERNNNITSNIYSVVNTLPEQINKDVKDFLHRQIYMLQKENKNLEYIIIEIAERQRIFFKWVLGLILLVILLVILLFKY